MRHVRFDERGAETGSWDGVRHRHSGESRRQQLSPIPTAAALLLDSTELPGNRHGRPS